MQRLAKCVLCVSLRNSATILLSIDIHATFVKWYQQLSPLKLMVAYVQTDFALKNSSFPPLNALIPLALRSEKKDYFSIHLCLSDRYN
jgi:hypothetical protein